MIRGATGCGPLFTGSLAARVLASSAIISSLRCCAVSIGRGRKISVILIGSVELLTGGSGSTALTSATATGSATGSDDSGALRRLVAISARPVGSRAGAGFCSWGLSIDFS